MMKIGLISDTHNILRQEVLDRLQSCDEIWHCGDFSKPEILEVLRRIAPMHAVRGNNDDDSYFKCLPAVDVFDCEGLTIALAHTRQLLNNVSADVRCFGHSHQVYDSMLSAVRWLNPGSCGRRRFYLDLTMMILTIRGKTLDVERIDIRPGA